MLKQTIILIFIATLVACGIVPEERRSSSRSAQPAWLGKTEPPQNITLLLPMTGHLSNAGQAVRDGFFVAYYAAQPYSQTQPQINIIDSNQNTNITALYQQAVNNGSDFVIGPIQKNKVEQLASQANITVPTLVLNTLPRNAIPKRGIYQFSLAQELEAELLADVARQQGYRNALLITMDNTWGRSVSQTLKQRWTSSGGTIVEELYITPKHDLAPAIEAIVRPMSGDNAEETDHRGRKLLTHRADVDVLFLLTPPHTARQVVPLLKYYYAGNLPSYAISSVYDSHIGAARNKDLDGLIICDMPSVQTEQDHTRSNSYDRLYALGMDAYAVTQTLPVQTQYWTYQGQTGQLSLNYNNQIIRQLNCGKMRQGRPQFN